MSEKIKKLLGDRAINITITKYLESQLRACNESRIESSGKLSDAIIDEINANLSNIDSDFDTYLSRTIANFKTLNQCFYYENRSDLDTVSIKSHLLDVLESAAKTGRAYITLPAHHLPKEAFINFFKDLGIGIEEVESTLTMFLQQIPKVEDDTEKYVCFGFQC